MINKPGVLIKTVSKDSVFYKNGIRNGDRISSINGEILYSELDYMFFISDRYLELDIERSGINRKINIERNEGQFTGITLYETPVCRCTNKCIFCFIDQMPPGLRKSLYIKDEDLRLSVMSGNYVTLSNFKHSDLENIVRIGLSPLYISVHATDPSTRKRMLGTKKAPDILNQLDFLASAGIRFHTQIVLCPTYNDGKTLKKTIKDLLEYETALASVAIVPVGLTRFSNPELVPVNQKCAQTICHTISQLSNSATMHDGIRKVYLADEFFIKASLPIPDNDYYEDYPQIENGVGLVRQLILSCNSIKSSRKIRKKEQLNRKMLLITSVSAEPFIQNIVNRSTLASGNTIKIIAVKNHFFGETVTVAGLLTGNDIIRAVKNELRQSLYDEIIVPDVIFNYAGYTLDGFSVERLSKRIGRPIRIVQLLKELFV